MGQCELFGRPDLTLKTSNLNPETAFYRKVLWCSTSNSTYRSTYQQGTRTMSHNTPLPERVYECGHQNGFSKCS